MDEATWLASDDPAAMLSHLHSKGVPDPGGGGGDPRVLVSDRKLRLFACACCRQVWHLLTDDRSRRAVEVAERFADGGATEEEWRDADFEATIDGDGPHDLCLWIADFGEPGWLRGFVRIAAQYGPPPALQAALLRDIIGNPFRPVTLPRVCLYGPICSEGGAERRGKAWFCRRCGHEARCPWLTPTVRALAEAAYRERPGRAYKCLMPSLAGGYISRVPDCPDCRGSGRVEDGALDPDRLRVLSDALEEAGCTEEGLLRHLRGEEPEPGVWHRCRDCGRVYRHIHARSGCCEGADYDEVTRWRPKRGPCVRGCHVLDALTGRG